jgi:tetratricopeptide (TPR) repeat protein
LHWPSLGPAHTIFGKALLVTGDFRRAAAEHVRAMELAPGDSWVNTMYGIRQQAMGHVAAGVAAARHATQLDPLSMEAFYNLPQILILGGYPADGIKALQHAEQLGFARPENWRLRSVAQLEMGDTQTAAAECVRPQDYWATECLAIAYNRLHDQTAADAQLAKMRASPDGDNTIEDAGVYAQWGRPNEALQLLGRPTAS